MLRLEVYTNGNLQLMRTVDTYEQVWDALYRIVGNVEVPGASVENTFNPFLDDKGNVEKLMDEFHRGPGFQIRLHETQVDSGEPFQLSLMSHERSRVVSKGVMVDQVMYGLIRVYTELYGGGVFPFAPPAQGVSMADYLNQLIGEVNESLPEGSSFELKVILPEDYVPMGEPIVNVSFEGDV